MINEILLQLESIIRNIDKYQQKFYEDFHTNYPNHLNFGRVTIKEIRTNNKIYDEFRSYLDKYTDRILEVSAYEFNLEEKFDEYDVRSRVKTVDAIETKLEHYYRRNIKGSVIVQKCLNDIMGFRVVLTEDIVESENFGNLIEKLIKEKIIFRTNYRNKLNDNYRGYHVYLKNKKNLNLPWELQIWYNGDEKENEKSHKDHEIKRSYIENFREE